jgi:hypothetical protein
MLLPRKPKKAAHKAEQGMQVASKDNDAATISSISSCLGKWLKSESEKPETSDAT